MASRGNPKRPASATTTSSTSGAARSAVPAPVSSAYRGAPVSAPPPPAAAAISSYSFPTTTHTRPASASSSISASIPSYPSTSVVIPVAAIDEKDSEGSSAVEVKCKETQAWYKAYIKDIKGGKASIRWENDWKKPEYVPISFVRKVPSPTDPFTFIPRVGDLVEAKARTASEEPFGWWQAKVAQVRGEFAMIQYTAWADSAPQIAERDLIRAPNSHAPFREKDLARGEVNVPPALRGAVRLDRLQSLLSMTGALSFSLDTKSTPNKLIVIGSPESIKSVKLVADMHMHNQVEISRLEEKKRQHEDEMRRYAEKMRDCTEIEFSVSPHLSGLVIGKGGSNIKTAEKMEGVRKVLVEAETGVVRVWATTLEQARAAQQQLEFLEDRYPVFRNTLPRVLGTGLKQLQRIITASQVVRIRVEDGRTRDAGDEDDEKTATGTDKKTAAKAKAGVSPADEFAALGGQWGDLTPEPDDTVHLLIVGSPAAVHVARGLLDARMEHLRQVTAASENERVAGAQLRAMRGDRPGGYGGYGRGGGGYGRGGRGARRTDSYDDEYTETPRPVGRGRGRGRSLKGTGGAGAGAKTTEEKKGKKESGKKAAGAKKEGEKTESKQRDGKGKKEPKKEAKELVVGPVVEPQVSNNLPRAKKAAVVVAVVEEKKEEKKKPAKAAPKAKAAAAPKKDKAPVDPNAPVRSEKERVAEAKERRERRQREAAGDGKALAAAVVAATPAAAAAAAAGAATVAETKTTAKGDAAAVGEEKRADATPAAATADAKEDKAEKKAETPAAEAEEEEDEEEEEVVEDKKEAAKTEAKAEEPADDGEEVEEGGDAAAAEAGADEPAAAAAEEEEEEETTE